MPSNCRILNTICFGSQLEGLTSLLKYSSIPLGCCGIVLHPEWQRCAYPVTFFTTAPLGLLQAAIAATDAEHVCPDFCGMEE